MQLKLSLATILVLASSAVAEDYVSINYVYYDEDSGRTTITTPSLELNKDFGADYTLNLSLLLDSVSGASPTYYDASSGASAKIQHTKVSKADIAYGDIPYADKRKAASFSFTTRFESRDELTIGADYSDENDYTAREFSAEYMHYLDPSKNRALTVGMSYQNNDVLTYCDTPNGICDTASGASSVTKKIHTFSSEVGLMQVLDKTSVFKTSLFYIHESGFLSNPYMHVIRDYQSDPKITYERKPDKRTAYGLTLEYSKAITQKLSWITNYRLYHDDWGITSHTLDNTLNYEVTPKLTIGGGLRFYTQSAADFYHAGKEYFTHQQYASSDRRMRKFHAWDYHATASYQVTPKTTLNFTASYYDQPDAFKSTSYSFGIKYNF